MTLVNLENRTLRQQLGLNIGGSIIQWREVCCYNPTSGRGIVITCVSRCVCVFPIFFLESVIGLHFKKKYNTISYSDRWFFRSCGAQVCPPPLSDISIWQWLDGHAVPIPKNIIFDGNWTRLECWLQVRQCQPAVSYSWTSCQCRDEIGLCRRLEPTNRWCQLQCTNDSMQMAMMRQSVLSSHVQW